MYSHSKKSINIGRFQICLDRDSLSFGYGAKGICFRLTNSGIKATFIDLSSKDNYHTNSEKISSRKPKKRFLKPIIISFVVLGVISSCTHSKDNDEVKEPQAIESSTESKKPEHTEPIVNVTENESDKAVESEQTKPEENIPNNNEEQPIQEAPSTKPEEPQQITDNTEIDSNQTSNLGNSEETSVASDSSKTNTLDTNNAETSDSAVVVVTPENKKESPKQDDYQPIANPVEEDELTVYWGKTGTKYHIDSSCRSFKGTTPNSGTIEDAEAEGRTGWCGICSKHM